MSTFPALTGAQLINALRKFGFDVVRIKEAIISFNIRMGTARWCQCIVVRRSDAVCLRRFYATAISRVSNSKKSSDKTSLPRHILWEADKDEQQLFFRNLG